ncbi:MAG: AraC family transcriptional regulator [Myxococcota bacterium]
MRATPAEILAPFEPTFCTDESSSPRPIGEAVDATVGAQLGEGLFFVGVSARVPSGFRMRARSTPGLTLEIHRRGSSESRGLTHAETLCLSPGIAATTFTDQPEVWETRASENRIIELFTVLADIEWLEQANLVPRRLAHLTLGYAPIEYGLLPQLPTGHQDETQSAIARLHLEGLVLQLLANSFGYLTRDPLPIRDAATCQRAKRARDYLVTTPLDKLSVVQAARTLSTSPRQLQRDFASVFGMGPVAYARQYRLSEVAGRIRSGELTIFEAAIEAGYSSSAAFSRAFYRAFGVRPSALNPRPDHR